MIKELERFVAVQLDAAEEDSAVAVMKNKKFQVLAMPVFVFYSSADVLAKDDWYNKKRTGGWDANRDTTESFLARLRALK